MKIRLIAADVDGTLVDSEKRISPATEAAVKKARELGAIFTLSTGRTVQGLGRYLYLVKPGTPIVTYNGAEVLIPDTGEVLYRQGLEASAAEEIIRSGMSLGASVIVWSRGVLYLSGKNERTEKYRRIYNAEGRPIWKPMHMQPLYRMNPFITASGSGRARSNAYIQETGFADVGADIFERGLCLPSDNKMTMEQVDHIVEIIRMCLKSV